MSLQLGHGQRFRYFWNQTSWLLYNCSMMLISPQALRVSQWCVYISSAFIIEQKHTTQINISGGRECLDEFRNELKRGPLQSDICFLILLKGSDFSPIIPYRTDRFLFKIRPKHVSGRCPSLAIKLLPLETNELTRCC